MRKFRRLATITLITLTILAVSSCSQGRDETLVPTGYQQWERTVPEPLTELIPGHTSRKRIIYINRIGTSVNVKLDESGRLRYTYPEGSILVKENYAANNEDVAMLTIMIKDSGDPRAVGGWLWVACDIAKGTERTFTGTELCYACHRNANEGHPYGDRNVNEEFRDYVFFPYWGGR